MNNIAGFGGPQNNPGGGGGGGAEPSCGDKIKYMWSQVPLFCRFIFWTSLGVYLLSWIYGPIVFMTLNIPALVYTKFQVWRVITAPFANPQLLMLLFGLCSYLPRGMQVEKMKGTTKFFLYFMSMSLISQ